MNPPPFNTFVARGTLERIVHPIQCGAYDQNVVVLYVDVTDQCDHKKNKVPFLVNMERAPLPDGIEVGDSLEIQFRLGFFKFAGGVCGAKLKVGRIAILRKWDEEATETKAVAETPSPAEDEIDELVRHLKEIKISKTGKGIN